MSFITTLPNSTALVNGLIGNTTLADGGINLSPEDFVSLDGYMRNLLAGGQSLAPNVELRLGGIMSPGVLQLLGLKFTGTDIQVVRARVVINGVNFINVQISHNSAVVMVGNMLVGGPVTGATLADLNYANVPFKTLEFYITTPFIDPQARCEFVGSYIPSAY